MIIDKAFDILAKDNLKENIDYVSNLFLDKK